MFALFKPITTILVLLMAIIYSRDKSIYYQSIVLSLFFCLIGDSLLINEKKWFFSAMISFCIAQFAIAFAISSIHGVLQNRKTLMLVALYMMTVLFFIFKYIEGVRFITILYILLTSLSMWQAINLYIHDRQSKHLFILIGVLFYFISDTIIGFELFVFDNVYAEAVGMLFYWGGITLISHSTRYS